MLSYRHAFHAGNHADVLKHLTQVLILNYLTQKNKGLCYIDTHAGRGAYSLTSPKALQNSEFESGIGRLWNQTDLPEPLAQYMEVLQTLNPEDRLTRYPGSPRIAGQLLRPQDRMRLYELHPSDFGKLSQWASKHKSIQLEQSDGFAGLIASLPPIERRAMVMIDPPYELKKDYKKCVEVLQESLKRFATGVYCLWYPLLGNDAQAIMQKKLRQFEVAYLNVELCVSSPKEGMYGSGMFIINPPWKLQEQMQLSLPSLYTLMAEPDAPEPKIIAANIE